MASNEEDNSKHKLEHWFRELRRKFLIHLPGLLVLIPILILSEKNLTKALAVFVLIAGAVHWYLDKRYLRRQKYKEALSGLKELFNQRFDWNDKQAMKNFNKAEESFVRGLVKNFGREQEKINIARPALYYLLGCLMANIFFGSEMLAFSVIALAIGDTFSTVIGKKFGSHKIFWNKEKSWEGFWAFVFSTSLGALAFSYVFSGFVFMPLNLLIFTTAFFGAVVESLPTINDNISIPVGVCLFLWIVNHLQAFF